MKNFKFWRDFIESNKSEKKNFNRKNRGFERLNDKSEFNLNFYS